MSALDIREDTFSIRVSNLSSETTLDDIRYVFSKFGHVANIYVPKPKGDEFRGFRDAREVKLLLNHCFVRYFAKEEADKAIQKMNGKEVEGRKMELTMQKNRRYIQEVEMQVKMMEAKGIDASFLKKELDNQTRRFKHEANGYDRDYKRERYSDDRDRDRDCDYNYKRERDYNDRNYKRERRSRSRDRSRDRHIKKESNSSRDSDRDRYSSSKNSSNRRSRSPRPSSSRSKRRSRSREIKRERSPRRR